MSRDIDRRLAQLEQQAQASKGMRIFKQGTVRRTLYFENEHETGRGWTADAIDALSAAGWTCVTVEYVDDWRGEPTCTA